MAFLDLSIKKPRELPPPTHVKIPQIHRSESAYGYHPPQERKSPAVYVSAVPRSQPKLPSPKLANPSAGSITRGTPIISQQPRYEGLLRQLTPETKMVGSITRGTPMHVAMPDKHYDYYGNKRTPPVMSNVAPPPPQGAYAPQHQYRQPAYLAEHQLSSRQIIMNDYYTSQQMNQRRNDKAYHLTSGSPHRTPPPPQQQQQRQGNCLL